MPNKDTLDERVVEMKIDNRQFVKGANNTISVLDKLKNALSFKNAAKGFNEVERAANRVDLSGITKGVDSIAEKFTFFGQMGQRVISNLTDSVYRFGETTLKMFTTDQINAGWRKYEDITSSIHTIMGATANNWDQTLERISKDYGFFGTQMDYVSMQMEKLNWFTDETSAALTDMVNNIGKFTNADVELDQATIAMMGISTWGYKSGASVNEISRAMYNLSQAMALGEVRLMDWRSIENANMATVEFKQTAIDTAVELETLTEAADGVFKTLSGKEVSATNFNENLSEGWFSSGVLQATLYKYGHFANVMETVVNDTGLSTRTLLDYVEEYRKGTFDVQKAQKELFQTMPAKDVPSVNALEYAVSLLTKQEDELGYKAFLASQETKTLTEAIEYTKDAVSSGWMKTWQYVFGDYEEAKEFWGDLTDTLYELFVAAGERRNAIFKVWHDNHGRDALIEALWNIYDTIMVIVQPIKDAFNDIFSWGSVDEAGGKLLDLTRRFRDFTRKLVVDGETLEGMRVVFTKLFTAAKVALDFIGKVFKVVGKVFGYVTKIVGAFFRAFSSGSFDGKKFLGEIKDIFGDIVDKIEAAYDKVKNFIAKMYDIPVMGPLLKILVSIFDKIGDAAKYVIGKLKEVKISGEGLKGPIGSISKGLEKISDFIKNINFDGSKFDGIFKKISGIISAVWEGLVGNPEEFKNKVKDMFNLAWNALTEEAKKIDFDKLLQGAKVGILGYIALKFANMVTSFQNATKSLQSIPDAISGVFGSIQDTFKSIQKSINANTYIKIAAAIAILAWSILQLSQIDDNKFMTVAATLVIVFALLTKAAKSLEKSEMFSGSISNKTGIVIKNISKTAQLMIGLGAVIAAAAYAMKQISGMTVDEISKGLWVIAIIIAMSIAALWGLNKLVTDEQGNFKSMLKLVGFATIIKAVGVALAQLAKLDIAAVLASAFAIGIVLSAIALVISQASKIEKGAVGMIAVIFSITAAVMALVIPLAVLAMVAKDNLVGLAIAAVVIAALIAVMAGFLYVGAKIGDIPGFNKFAKTLLIVSAAMLLFAIATAIAVPAIIAIIGVFSAFVMLLTAMPEEMFSTMAGRLALIGAALIPLAAAALIAGVGILAFGVGVLAASIGVGIFATSILKMAASIALVAVAVKLFVSAAAQLVQTVSEYGDEFVKVIEWLLLAIIGLIVGYKMYIANAALTVIITIVSVLASVGGDQMIALVRFLILKIAAVLYQLVGLLSDLIVGFIVYLINAVTESIQKNKEQLIMAIEKLVGTILSLVIETAIRLIADVLNTLVGWIAKLFGVEDFTWLSDKGKELADALGDGITDSFEESTRLAEESGKDTGGTMVEMAKEGAEAKAPDLSSSLTGLMGDAMTDANSKVSEDSPTIGNNFIAGFDEGMWGAYPDLQTSIGDITGNISSDFAAGLQIHSPSRISDTFGRYWDLGLAFGIKNNIGEVTNANEDLSTEMQNSLMGAMAIVGMIADQDLTLSPLVKPVVDLSNIDSANSAMSGMFQGDARINAGAINSRIKAMNDLTSEVSSRMDDLSKNAPTGESWTINIYSQPGMDENELANAVMYKIQNGIIRKGAALG